MTCIGETVFIRFSLSEGVRLRVGRISEVNVVPRLKFELDLKWALSWCFARSKSRIIGIDISDIIREWAVAPE
jgi:hypothetical protein